MFFASSGDGIADDTFCHLIDAWVEGEMGCTTPAKIDKAVDALDPFRHVRGDRFSDAADLAQAINEWKLMASKREVKAAEAILSDLLGMWRSLEE